MTAAVNQAQQAEISGLPGAAELIPGGLDDGSDAGFVQGGLV